MAIDEVDTIDECQNFLNESTNVQINSEPINENFGTRMAADAFYIPKYGKARLGEDAHFICIEEQTIGVADGVGGWAKWGNSDKSDDPSVAQEIEVPVEIWDVIVMGSDGLFDNVHDFELEALVQDRLIDLYEFENTKMLARKIAEYALKNSKNKLISTPFSTESLKAGKQRIGGYYSHSCPYFASIVPYYFFSYLYFLFASGKSWQGMRLFCL
ncbi:hypothetical protein A4A49_54032 [Nicotiana attenuata]|uniref:Protein phosphatase n=1 Tax=Nicotiana attenuata TaxID=49451 RepID=A0A314KQ76_NICAT|nr:hypothetical protein A4A49_54032 [Nicotiana attenuata]